MTKIESVINKEIPTDLPPAPYEPVPFKFSPKDIPTGLCFSAEIASLIELVVNNFIEWSISTLDVEYSGDTTIRRWRKDKINSDKYSRKVFEEVPLEVKCDTHIYPNGLDEILIWLVSQKAGSEHRINCVRCKKPLTLKVVAEEL